MIHHEDRDGVAVLRMEHGKANAVDDELFDDLEARLDEVEKAGARAVVLTGTGSIFSAGVNLFKVVEGGEGYLASFLPQLSHCVRRFFICPLPVVAAVNGHAIAGGAVIAAACDRRILAEGDGKLGFTELLVGVPFPVAALEAVRYLLPAHRVQDLVLTGRTVKPPEALAMGLVEELAPPEEVVDRAVERAAAMGRIRGEAFAMTKRQLRLDAVERMDRLGAEIDAQILASWTQPEVRETIRAFLEATVGKR